MCAVSMRVARKQRPRHVLSAFEAEHGRMESALTEVWPMLADAGYCAPRSISSTTAMPVDRCWPTRARPAFEDWQKAVREVRVGLAEPERAENVCPRLPSNELGRGGGPKGSERTTAPQKRLLCLPILSRLTITDLWALRGRWCRSLVV